MKIDVNANNIRKHLTYYITCCMCGQTIEHTANNLVVEEAKKNEWKYDTKRDAFFCGQCKEKINE